MSGRESSKGRKAPAKKGQARPVGAPTIFKQATADEICERIAAGESLRAICRDKRMPAASTVFKWLNDKPDFAEQYAHAREAQADTLADEIVAIADEECTTVRADKHGTRADDGDGNTEVVFDSAAVARNRLRVDARKWVASKLKPRKYGDKVAIGGADDLPPVRATIDTSKLSDAALKELLSARAAPDGG